ncbi:MAG: hypothetical protein WCV84_03685 [Patescibacteria group bacterium]
MLSDGVTEVVVCGASDGCSGGGETCHGERRDVDGDRIPCGMIPREVLVMVRGCIEAELIRSLQTADETASYAFLNDGNMERALRHLFDPVGRALTSRGLRDLEYVVMRFQDQRLIPEGKRLSVVIHRGLDQGAELSSDALELLREARRRIRTGRAQREIQATEKRYARVLESL